MPPTLATSAAEKTNTSPVEVFTIKEPSGCALTIPEITFPFFSSTRFSTLSCASTTIVKKQANNNANKRLTEDETINNNT